ncbi:hypothetical protein BDE02_06G106000 [Populus trichocarpa]|nr:hypothetical protein BDE02_06G106000 [Populus trichocarpa]
MRANSLSCVVSCLSTEEIQFNKFIILQKFFKRGGLNKKLRLSYSGMGSKGQLLHPQETTVTLILLLSRQPYNQEAKEEKRFLLLHNQGSAKIGRLGKLINSH